MNNFSLSYFQNVTPGIKRAGLEKNLQAPSRPNVEIKIALHVVSMYFMIDIHQKIFKIQCRNSFRYFNFINLLEDLNGCKWFGSINRAVTGWGCSWYPSTPCPYGWFEADRKGGEIECGGWDTPQRLKKQCCPDCKYISFLNKIQRYEAHPM